MAGAVAGDGVPLFISAKRRGGVSHSCPGAFSLSVGVWHFTRVLCAWHEPSLISPLHSLTEYYTANTFG